MGVKLMVYAAGDLWVMQNLLLKKQGRYYWQRKMRNAMIRQFTEKWMIWISY